ncbi:MAG TPA: acetylornithine transaminase [Actinomycetaceae bacterium]|nr:acetylornithine transaminase [Actinomycetaceae bacterium]
MSGKYAASGLEPEAGAASSDGTAASADWRDDFAASYMRVYGSPQLQLIRGSGARVWDSDGREYLDLLAGIAVNALGHANPAIVEAVARQFDTLGHISGLFSSPPQIAIARKLLELADAPAGSHVMLVNSGSESNETALKMALRHRPGGRMVALEGAFHGRTLGAVSLTWKSAYREPFVPMTGNVSFVPRDDVAALAAELEQGEVAAVFLEVIQGEAGIYPLSQEYVEAARALTRDHGALLVIDEVQTGAGRTGEWLGHTHYGISPDVVTMAKGLGGGFPVGAVIGYGEASNLLAPGQHGNTFGGNPPAATAALTVVDQIIPLLPRIAELGERWRAELVEVPGVTEVRGRGLLIGVELDRPSAPVQARLIEEGIIANAVNPTTLRLAPPFIISDDDASHFTATLRRVLGE